MEPQVSRLVELWSSSLENSADAASMAELDALLAQPEMAQALTDWQVEHSALEAVEVPALKAGEAGRVLAQYRRQQLWDRFKPLAMGLGAVAVLGGGYWMMSGDDGLTHVPSQVAQLVEVDLQATPVPAPRVRKHSSLPPGYGVRTSQLRRRTVSSSTLQWTLSEAAEVQVVVVDATGAELRVLWQGVAAAGGHSNDWDGKLSTGQAAPAGSYRVLARTRDRVVALRETDVLAP